MLNHHIFTSDTWQRASAVEHPVLCLKISTNRDDYRSFNVRFPKIQPKYINVVVDSGAQSCLWSRKDFLKNGFSTRDLIQVKHSMKAANTAPITIDGAIFLRLSGETKNGHCCEAAVMVYISPDAKDFYLSKEAMIQLGIISRNFPQIGAANESTVSPIAQPCLQEEEVSHSTCQEDGSDSVRAECGCLKRDLPPEMPSSLPFPCTSDNKGKMKKWLLDRYASSTFNKCPHQVLPTMEGPPIQIHMRPDAQPIALRKPAPVPLHWQEQVENDLRRDVALGVLERVPHGEPTKWCFRMVVTRKDNGNPRRTVDLSPLNKYCEREAHGSKSPFNLARSVPTSSVKTVFDAWNGYHSVPIRAEDRHLTTFTTPWGLFRYKRAPQGFLSSGDGYNRRFDDIAAHIERMERCIDDTLLHDTDLEMHWWRAMEFIQLCGKSGIVLNAEKLQFAEESVDFAGFRIADDSVEPLPKYLDAIRLFPTPANITDVRSWFGLVNQVAHYAQLREMMEPFRKFLSPKTKFAWNDELEKVFIESKSRIVDAIKEGVRIFDVTKRTCLRTDWSKKGIGYFLSQKHCNCGGARGRSFGCCPDGWKVTLAGSRFLTPTEKNYAPVEGEALAVAWSLEQTRFFTMGCNDLLMIVDHKPLTKIFGDRRLDEICNPRLFRLKRRTLMWRFDIEYKRGSKNPFADAMSRHPNEYAELASLSLMSTEDVEEQFLIAGIISEAGVVCAVTWERIKEASQKDGTICALIDLIDNGFPSKRADLTECMRPFWETRDHLYVHDGAVLYKDRIVVPQSLRPSIIENLHSAHQGVSTMFSRAEELVYWPGMISDITAARENCRLCHKNAPSQAKLPPTAPKMPTTPFQMIFGDYFQLNGKYFLVIGDRLSGWTEVVQVNPGTKNSGSKGLCNALRQVYATFGVANEISSDGGPEFVSAEAKDFYSRWGTKHRVSSAYFPQSNGRAEVAVKVTKRILEDNMGADGNLNTDKVVRALLQLRNTPDKDCKLSPAQVLFGRNLRDSMPMLDKSTMIFESGQLHNQWHQAWSAKEEAIRTRLIRSCEVLERGCKELPPLREGEAVLIQNQDNSSGRGNKWDRQGRVIAAKSNDQYLVKVDGTGRLTLRNRRFLRKFQARTDTVCDYIPPAAVKLPEHDVRRNEVHVPQNIDSGISRSDAEKIHSPMPAPDNPHPVSETDDPMPAPDHPPPVSETDNPPPVSETDEMPLDDTQPRRRSSRSRVQRTIYDANTGTYIVPTSK